MKKCVCCKKEKEVSEYGPSKAFKCGLDSSCRECRRRKVRAYRSTPRGRETARGTVERYHKSAKGRAAKRRYEETDNGRAKRRMHAKVHKEKYPEKKSARDAAYQSIKQGKLKRKPCEFCGSFNTEAHHEDYSRPLDVRWLCKVHHDAAHDRFSEVRYAL